MLRKEQRADEFKWRANQMRLMFVLLETYPAQSSQQLTNELQHSLELFSGYYAMQVMLNSISRKNAFNLQVREKRALLGEGATTAAIFEEKEV
jgi:hypothetical protein